MDSFLKRSSIVIDDDLDLDITNDYQNDDNLTQSTVRGRSKLLSSQNSSSSSSSLSIRSQSPDFSSTITMKIVDPKKQEKMRQEALNKSLEEISRELKEIENCFTVAEEILKKERERDEELYKREIQRKILTPPEQSGDSIKLDLTPRDSSSGVDDVIVDQDDDKMIIEISDKNENNFIIENKNLNKPRKVKSPTFKINAVRNRGIGSPLICNSRLYFRNGVIGCDDAEKEETNFAQTHNLVKNIIKQENVSPLVPYEQVKRIIADCRSPILSKKDIIAAELARQFKRIDPAQLEMDQRNIDEMVEEVIKEKTAIASELELEADHDLGVEVGTPIEDEKISVNEPVSVLNDEYVKRSSEEATEGKIPIPRSSSIHRRSNVVQQSPTM